MQVQVQGLINLADNRDEDGGFTVVPGFHKLFLKWTEHTRNTLGKKYSDKMVSLLSCTINSLTSATGMYMKILIMTNKHLIRL